MSELLAFGKDAKNLSATFSLTHAGGTVSLSGDGVHPELRLTASEVAAALKAWTPSPPPPPKQKTFGGFTAATPPPMGWTPYLSSSAWNQPVGTTVLPNSEAMCAFVTSGKEVENLATGGGTNVHYGPGFTVVYWASETDPLVNLEVTEAGSSLSGLAIRCPTMATPCNDGDAHMTVVQPSGVVYDFWQCAKPSNGVLNASGAGMSNLATGEGLCTVGAADASGTGLLAGTIRVQELIAGHIPHPLAASIWECRALAPIPPANPAWGDGTSSNTNAPREGQAFVLNMTEEEILALKAGSVQTTILLALAEFGFYAVDGGGGGISFKMEGYEGYTSFGLPNPLKSWCESHSTGAEPYDGEYVWHINSLVDWGAKLVAVA